MGGAPTPMSIQVCDAKKGMVIRHQGRLHQITGCDQGEQGDPPASRRLVLKELTTGRRTEVSMNGSDSVDLRPVETRPALYLFKDAMGHAFMDEETHEEFHLSKELVGNALDDVAANESIPIGYTDGTRVVLL